MFAAPAVAGEQLFIGSCAGLVYALNKRTGDTLWTYDTFGKSFHGDPIVTDSLLIIPTDDRWFDGAEGPVLCLRRADGSLVWRFDPAGFSQLGIGVTTSLTLAEDKVIGVTMQDEVVALDLATGDLRWRYRTDYDTTNNYWASVPVVVDSTVYHAGLDGSLTALALGDGAVRWRADIGSRVTTSLGHVDGSLYCGAENGFFYRWSTDGAAHDSLALDGMPIYLLGVSDERLIVLNSPNAEFNLNLVTAVDPSLDSLLWETASEAGLGWTIKQTYFWRDFVLAGDADGVVSLMNKDTGVIEASFGVTGEIRSLGFDDNVIYVGTISGMVYAVGAL
ncbi:MAG TPA: PQQ-binding-like beta-propeller repeat protein [candidate division Zixibacteria bacterium]|nr:PQQ-binding-like beta-propeller repeat protein [candidate division Zixibacteria bacterium]